MKISAKELTPIFYVKDFNEAVRYYTEKLLFRKLWDVEARIEKRLAGLLGELAAHKKMTVGETIEKMMLHSFERVDGSGVASPHTDYTLEVIGDLKKKHGIDYDCHANYRFVEDRR